MVKICQNMRLLTATFVACSTAASPRPIIQQAADASPSEMIYSVIARFYKGPNAHGDLNASWRATWKLLVTSSKVTLSVTYLSEEPVGVGAPESYIFGGISDGTNAGIPTKMRLSDGRTLLLHCEKLQVQVHQPGATPRLKCDSQNERFDGWSDTPTAVIAIRCNQDLASNIYFPFQDPIVFADRPVELINNTCCTRDMCDPYGDIRFAERK